MPHGPSVSGTVAAILLFALRECIRTRGGLALRMGDGACCVVCWWSAAWSSEEWSMCSMVDTGGEARAGGARASSAPGTALRWACWRRGARLAQAPSHSMDASFPMVPGGSLLPEQDGPPGTGLEARVRLQVAGRRAMGNAPCSGVCAEAERTSTLAAKPLDATRVDRSKPAPGPRPVCATIAPADHDGQANTHTRAHTHSSSSSSSSSSAARARTHTHTHTQAPARFQLECATAATGSRPSAERVAGKSLTKG